MSLVRIKAGSDEEPAVKRILTPEEFQKLLPLIPEPYRSACCYLPGAESQRDSWPAIERHRMGEVRDSNLRAVALATIGKVKTPKSKSVMPLDPGLASSPLEYKRNTTPHAHPEQWVFENPARGKPWRPSDIQSKWVRPAVLKVTGEDGIGWHNFRHTFSSMLRELGADIKVQQELFRHADVRTTLQIYTRLPARRSAKRREIG